MYSFVSSRNVKINGLIKNARSVTRKSARRTKNVRRTVRTLVIYAMIVSLHHFTNSEGQEM